MCVAEILNSSANSTLSLFITCLHLEAPSPKIRSLTDCGISLKVLSSMISAEIPLTVAPSVVNYRVIDLHTACIDHWNH